MKIGKLAFLTVHQILKKSFQYLIFDMATRIQPKFCISVTAQVSDFFTTAKIARGYAFPYHDYFCNIWAIFSRNRGRGVTSQRVRIKIWEILFHPHDSWSSSCKKNLIPTFSSFATTDHKGHFRKWYPGFLSLAAFLGTTPTFLKKNVLDFFMQKLILNQLAPI